MAQSKFIRNRRFGHFCCYILEIINLPALPILLMRTASSFLFYPNTFNNTGVTNTVITPATPMDKLLIAP